jgi:putative Holliday junction resolvase
MKLLGLDLGDRWVGIAISDGLQMTCRPLKTATVDTIENELIQIFKQEFIEKIIVGLPTTMRGTSSEQTEKIKIQATTLIAELNIKIKKNIPLEFCDERLSSKRAQTVMIEKNTQKKGAKNKEHAIAAAFILQNYLDAQAFKRATQEDYLS